MFLHKNVRRIRLACHFGAVCQEKNPVFFTGFFPGGTGFSPRFTGFFTRKNPVKRGKITGFFTRKNPVKRGENPVLSHIAGPLCKRDAQVLRLWSCHSQESSQMSPEITSASAILNVATPPGRGRDFGSQTGLPSLSRMSPAWWSRQPGESLTVFSLTPSYAKRATPLWDSGPAPAGFR